MNVHEGKAMLGRVVDALGVPIDEIVSLSKKARFFTIAKRKYFVANEQFLT